MIVNLPHIYLITDRHQVRKGLSLLETVEELLSAGVRIVQLREKDLSAKELFPLAMEMRKLTNKYNCQLIVNDRIDIAQGIEADGVHLGNHSLPVTIARQILGKEKLIGVSTHSQAEIDTAYQQGADFITYSPIYFTPSKARMGKPVGVKSLRNVCQTCPLPVYALGGIKIENCRETIDAGAHGIALISELLSAENPTQNYQQLLRQLT